MTRDEIKEWLGLGGTEYAVDGRLADALSELPYPVTPDQHCTAFLVFLRTPGRPQAKSLDTIRRRWARKIAEVTQEEWSQSCQAPTSAEGPSAGLT